LENGTRRVRRERLLSVSSTMMGSTRRALFTHAHASRGDTVTQELPG